MNDHDAEDPMVFLAQLDAEFEAVNTQCAHCKLDVEVLPAGPARYAIGTTHEAGCPDEVVEEVIENVELWTGE